MGKDLLAKYYDGILNRLRGELDFINELFQHHGIKGEGNENVIRDLIQQFIPAKYGVGTGIVIDKDGTPSKQCDIVIYDKHNFPSLLSLTSMHIFPVDLVCAVIEVKTSLDSTKSKEAIQNIKSIRSLDYIQDTFRFQPTDPIGANYIQDDTIIWQDKSTIPPVGIIFAYRSSTNKFETFANWFQKENDEDTPAWPSHVFCLDQGFISSPGWEPRSCHASSLVEEGKPWVTDEEDEIIEINGTEWSKLAGRLYPLSEYNGEKLFIDQGKLLLHFVLILSKVLDKKYKHISPNIDFGKDYLSEDYQIFTKISEKEAMK